MAEITVTSVSKISYHFNVQKVSELNLVWSPEFLVQNTPWKVKVYKYTQDIGGPWLGINLFSTKNDKPLNWTHAAFATFKLLPFDNKLEAIKRETKPYVFTSSGCGTGFPYFCSWTDLFDKQKCYVEDDTINLKIQIVAEDVNMINRSQLNIESIEKSCECGCVANIRLVVRNIKYLMAIQTPKFELRNIPWKLTVFKDSSMLGLRLRCDQLINDVSCRIKMSVKLFSSEDGVYPIKKVNEQNARLSLYLYMDEICSWDELLKPENGFVNNDSIELHVKIKAKQLGDIQNDIQPAAKRLKMECAICFESIEKQNISSTPCGHLFCTACITPVIKGRPVCPFCGAQAPFDGLHRVYLPIIN